MESKERGPRGYYWICALLGFSLPIIFFLGPDIIEALPAALAFTAAAIFILFAFTPRGRSLGGVLSGVLGVVSFLGGLAAAFLVYVGLIFYALSF